MFILVYGAKGWIGGQFMEILKNSDIRHVSGTARVDDEEALRNEIERVNPSHVVSFIGRTHGKIGDQVFTTIDYLEQKGKLVENVRDNLFSPLLLAEICTKQQIHYTYLGTGCIFNYDDEHPYGVEVNGFEEESVPNFFGSSYSVVKGFTDRLMHLYSDTVLNLRIRMPITGEKNPRNFITKIVQYEKICSIPNSMTVLPEMLPYVLKMMKQNVTGTVNLTNPGLIEHNEILQMYQEIVDPEFQWKNFSLEEQRLILASDRSNNFLETERLEFLFPYVRNIKDAVRQCLVDYQKSMPDSVVENGSPVSVEEEEEVIVIENHQSCILNWNCFDFFNTKKEDDVVFEEEDTEEPVSEKNVNLLVTGGCGFIGSNFINHIFPKGKVNTLVNIDAMYYCANLENVDEEIRLSDGYVFIHGNLREQALVDETLKKYEITHVIHFAAQSHVQNSFSDSIKFTYDNILGTHTLLESARNYGKIEKFIHVSTDEVYGESMNHVDEQHKTEQSILCPTNPYAATKAGAELIAQSYEHSYKMPIIITRGNNVYGPNQYPEKLIPLFIKLLKENKKLTIQGDGSSVRAFLHAYDTAKAFECILEKGVVGEIYNIGCDEGMEYSVMEVAEMLVTKMKPKDELKDWIEFVEDRPYNDKRYYISNQKLKDLGWNIEIKLEDGLSDLIDHL
jgi:dTDP-glucose 4,6-dehydratase